ncbi:MAG: amidohydrolase family protein [Thermoleophilia bacterium]
MENETIIPTTRVPARVDLTGCEILDNHCHGFRAHDLLDRDPEGWEDRLTMMGTCFASSGQTEAGIATQVAALRDSTLFTLTARRWLAEYLGVSADHDTLTSARRSALAADPNAYVRGLMTDAHITAVIADDGYPQPPVSRAEFAEHLGVSVYRVARIEPWIAELQAQALSFVDFETAFEGRLDEAAADPLTVGYKSVIAYRTGLDVGNPTRAEAASSYEAWQVAGWPKDRGPGKAVRDFCLRAALRAARRHDRVMHIHCGGGDPDIVLSHVRPQDIFSLLHDYMDQPIVLIHSGWPWLVEAAYIASIMPFVYLDLSEFLPWASIGIDRELEILLGVTPSAKLLYGSDEASEPEVFWLSARLTREALERVLTHAFERDQLSLAEAHGIGLGIMGENSKRLHGIA